MKIIQGDLIQFALEGKFDVIVHGCNCFCTMGAGIAKQIKTIFPEAFIADQITESGLRDKLGTITCAAVERNSYTIVIVNGYTQYMFGAGIHINYDAIKEVFAIIKNQYAGMRIGYPKIGAGLAGGDWNRIADLIKRELIGEDHTLVVL